MARVTVCLAVYNGAATLEKALDAVFAQTYRDFDVLLVDDGSTDDTPAIAARYDLRMIRVPNAGVGLARNLMVREATGELLAFVDHDDFWVPEKLEKQVALLDSTGASLVHADCWFEYEDGRVVERNLSFSPTLRSFDHVLPSNSLINSSVVFRRQDMLDAGNFVGDTIRCSDWYGWLILAKGRKFVHLPEKLVHYSVLSTSLANAGYKFHDGQRYLLQEKILPRADELFDGLPESVANSYKRLIRVKIGIALSSMAVAAERKGDRSDAKRLHRMALREAPTVPRVWTRAMRSLVRR